MRRVSVHLPPPATPVHRAAPGYASHWRGTEEPAVPLRTPTPLPTDHDDTNMPPNLVRSGPKRVMLKRRRVRVRDSCGDALSWTRGEGVRDRGRARAGERERWRNIETDGGRSPPSGDGLKLQLYSFLSCCSSSSSSWFWSTKDVSVTDT